MGEETQARTGRWVRIALVVSLAMNLLIAGAVVGAVFSGGKWLHHDTPRLQVMSGPLTRALSEQDRHAIRRGMRAALRDGTAARNRHRAEFAGLMEDLKASPFDPAAVEARLVTIRELIGAQLSLGEVLLVKRLAAMDAAGRAAYAERLEQVLQRRH